MTEPVWLDPEAVVAAHDEVIARTGGASGVRDAGLLESALMRPQNRWAYEGVDRIIDLAATYAVALAKNHPFIDGNKRAAFVGMAIFLMRNGFVLTASNPDATATMIAVASGQMDEDALAAWLRANTEPG